eukprot:2980788-Amphidinium_carterae.1
MRKVTKSCKDIVKFQVLGKTEGISVISNKATRFSHTRPAIDNTKEKLRCKVDSKSATSIVQRQSFAGHCRRHGIIGHRATAPCRSAALHLQTAMPNHAASPQKASGGGTLH